MNGSSIFRTGEQLIGALAYLESLGVVHRDIKPANVMIDKAGVVKLIDFNLTRDTGQKTDMAGTRGYMPPDFMAWGPRVDSFVDRYAVGVILYELITGDHPYASRLPNSQGQAVAAMPTDARTIRPDLSEAAAEFLMRAVAPKETHRFATAAEMLRAWSNLEADMRVLA
jgi:serine/threonine-protein kinase